MARQKKPLAVVDMTSIEQMAQVSPSAVDSMLKVISFTSAHKDSKHRKVYEYVRNELVASLTPKQHEEPLFPLLIERIARMTVILDKIERKLFDGIATMTEDELVANLGGHYRSYLKDYRSFITSLSDLKWAGDTIQKTKSVETIREITREVEDDTAT